jgi:hypothetical protein
MGNTLEYSFGVVALTCSDTLLPSAMYATIAPPAVMAALMPLALSSIDESFLKDPSV